MEITLDNNRFSPLNIIFTHEELITKFRHCFLDTHEFGGYYIHSDEKTSIFEYDFFKHTTRSVEIRPEINGVSWHTHPTNVNSVSFNFPSLTDIIITANSEFGVGIIFTLLGVMTLEFKHRSSITLSDSNRSIYYNALTTFVSKLDFLNPKKIMNEYKNYVQRNFKEIGFVFNWFDYPETYIDISPIRELMKPQHPQNNIKDFSFKKSNYITYDSFQHSNVQLSNREWELNYTVLYDKTDNRELYFNWKDNEDCEDEIEITDIHDNAFFILKKDCKSINKYEYNVVDIIEDQIIPFKIKSCFYTPYERFFITDDKGYFPEQKAQMLLSSQKLKSSNRVYHRFTHNDIRYFSIYSNPNMILSFDNYNYGINNNDLSTAVIIIHPNIMLLRCDESEGEFEFSENKMVGGVEWKLYVPIN